MNTNFKTSILALSAAIFFFITCSTYTQFLKTYSFSAGSIECGRSIELSVLNTYTVSGYSNSVPNAGNYDWLFQKMDGSGNNLCNLALGYAFADSCFSHTKVGTTYGNVLAGFYTLPSGLSGRETASWSFVDESSCTHLGSRSVVDSFKSQYRSVIKGRTGTDFVLAGTSQANTGWMILKNKILAGNYSSMGALLWLNRYSTGNNRHEAGFSICYQPFDSTYAITGVLVDSAANGNMKRVFVLKLSTNGIPVWYRIYRPQTAAYQHIRSESRRIIAMPDGSFVIAGWTEESVSPANNNIWIFRINGSSGNPVWSYQYGYSNVTEQCNAIERDFNGTALVTTGFTTRYGQDDIFNMKVDGSGNFLWAKSPINTSANDRGYDVDFAKKMIHSTAFYWFTGQYQKTAVNQLNSYLMKTSLSGNITPYYSCIDTLTVPKIQTPVIVDSAYVFRTALGDQTISPKITNKNAVMDTVCQIKHPAIVEEADNNNNAPSVFELSQNYPNPFNPSTLINFSVPEGGNVTLRVFDAAGREVSVVVNEFRNAGSYTAEFNAASLPSGVYFYRLTAGSFEETKKMLLVK